MSALDQQLMVKDQVDYSTEVTPDRTFEFNGGESIKDDNRRTEGDPLRVGTFVKRSDRFTPWYAGAAGSLQMDVMTKGMGWWLKHMLGQVVTTGPTETSVYTHTATMADLYGKFFTAQLTRPFHPSGTVQPVTHRGGKVTKWTISNSVEGNLVLDLDVDFQACSTATATATAGYPASMDPLTWAGGIITVGGSQFDVTEIAIEGDNGLNVDRRYISGTTNKKEPTGGRREVSFSMEADFESLAMRNRAVATTRAGTLASIVATWTGPTLLGTTIYPTFQVNIPAARFDDVEATNGGPEGISQSISGVGLYDGSSSAVSVIFKSADSVA